MYMWKLSRTGDSLRGTVADLYSDHADIIKIYICKVWIWQILDSRVKTFSESEPWIFHKDINMSVHQNGYHHHQDGYSSYNSYYYYGHPPPQHNLENQSHQTGIYEDSYVNTTYWAEEDDISTYSSSSQSGSPGELTPTPSTCSAKDIYEDSHRHFLATSVGATPHEIKPCERPTPTATVLVRKKGVGGRRKNEKPPTQIVLKKRRLAANAR